jgi:hypothetical protein
MSRHIDGGYGERADGGRQPGQTGPAAAVSGDSIAIAGYLGRSDQFDRSIAAFSQRYTDQNELDYQALATAIRSGCLEALEGVRGAIL